ncbi:MAG: hypothetical protein U0794_06155 [Isosphaeraceae bacterium]
MAIAAFVHDPVWLAVVLGAAFFGNDLAMGPAWAAAADIGERSAGTLGGTMNMVGSITAALGAVLAGHLLDDRRILLLFAVLAASYGLGRCSGWGRRAPDLAGRLHDEHRPAEV